ncbi:MAG: hypothetical protein WAL16_24075, partial [Streptosporangiaceae bacterium]
MQPARGGRPQQRVRDLPPPFLVIDPLRLETATATTRVHAYRPHPGGEPVVLLSAFNSVGLHPYAAALAGGGPVYGIDLPGDANPSIARALLTPPEN